VKVSGQSEKLTDEESILLPKEMFSYEKESGEAKKAEIEIEDIFSWKDDILLFKNADYPELKATLERWYSVDFIEETQLLIQEDFSGKFEKTSLEKVLEALNYTSHFQYQLNNNKVYVTNLNNEN
jgi:ferric-dicitrate binding protein FerR (iron transport regulator)